MLVSKTKPCKSKYKLHTARLQKAHYISYRVHDGPNCYMDNCSNSRANTCRNPFLCGEGGLISYKCQPGLPVLWWFIIMLPNHTTRSVIRRYNFCPISFGW